MALSPLNPAISNEATPELKSAIGSFNHCGENILQQIERLEELFTVPTEQLKKITDHFVNELNQGLTEEGGDIVSNRLPT
jgi:hexokinase